MINENEHVQAAKAKVVENQTSSNDNRVSGTMVVSLGRIGDLRLTMDALNRALSEVIVKSQRSATLPVLRLVSTISAGEDGVDS